MPDKTPTKFDYLIIGGGIIGLSTAMQLLQRLPGKKIAVLEKETSLAQHQTGHNSGVIHAGVYYPPDSLKADFCMRGADQTFAFCKQYDIPHEQCGKLLVATNLAELERMQSLYERCKLNGLNVDLLNEAQLKEQEPNVSGLGAIYVRTTGIVDYRQVCEKIAEIFTSLGGVILLGHEVCSIKEETTIVLKVVSAKQTLTIQTDFLISCAGLMADRITRMMGIPINFQIIPFRGEYYLLPQKYSGIVKHHIYPIPDPELPFLGVHLTRMIDGSITVGPNAVQGWKREGYGRINISLKDILDMVSFYGFWRLMARYFKVGLIETKNSWWKPGYLRLVQKYCPKIRLQDLLPHPAGIRAQAVLEDGTLVHDFLFAENSLSLHVCNAPSPAATSAFPIGEYIVNKVVRKTTRLNSSPRSE